jgi:hypothetical protein
MYPREAPGCRMISMTHDLLSGLGVSLDQGIRKSHDFAKGCVPPQEQLFILARIDQMRYVIEAVGKRALQKAAWSAEYFARNRMSL